MRQAKSQTKRKGRTAHGERAPSQKPKKEKAVQLTGRFELPSTDSESVVIAATLREQGMQRLRVAQ